jgi:hypothetical protein
MVEGRIWGRWWRGSVEPWREAQPQAGGSSVAAASGRLVSMMRLKRFEANCYQRSEAHGVPPELPHRLVVTDCASSGTLRNHLRRNVTVPCNISIGMRQLRVGSIARWRFFQTYVGDNRQ